MTSSHFNKLCLYKLFHQQGLSLELFVEQNEYINDLTQEAGMHVVVHDNGEMPFPQDQGLNIAPQFLTSVGVRRVSIFSFDLEVYMS